MGSYTAQILIGTACPYHSGIEPTHALYLRENDRPSWQLLNIGNVVEHTYQYWVPTVEHMLEDGILMVSIYVFKDKEITALFNKIQERESRLKKMI